MTWNPVKKEIFHQYYVGYMTNPMQKKHRNHRKQVIKIFELAFKPVTLNSIKNELTKKNLSVLSLSVGR